MCKPFVVWLVVTSECPALPGDLANRRKVQPGQLLAYGCWLYPAAVCLLTVNWSEFRILGFLFGRVGSRAKDVTVCPAVTHLQAGAAAGQSVGSAAANSSGLRVEAHGLLPQGVCGG